MKHLLVLFGELAQVFFAAARFTEIIHHGAVSGVDQLDDRFSEGGFSAARLPYQPERFSPVDVEVDVVDRLNMVCYLVEKTAADWEEGFYAPQFKQDFLVRYTHPLHLTFLIRTRLSPRCHRPDRHSSNGPNAPRRRATRAASRCTSHRRNRTAGQTGTPSDGRTGPVWSRGSAGGSGFCPYGAPGSTAAAPRCTGVPDA